MQKNNRSKRLEVRISPEDKTALERMAIGGLTMADVVSLAIRNLSSMNEAERLDLLEKLTKVLT